MVARSRPHEAVAMTPRVEAMGVGAISKNHTFEEREDVVQEPLLSTTTAASSMIASLSSAEEEEDDDVRVQDGESEDADDEGSDEDHLYILSEEEKRATPIVDAPEQTPQDGPENDANKGKDEDHTSSEEETPAENVKRKASPPQAPRFSLISIPRRVRASVFARRPKASPQPILLEHDATLEDKEKVSDESTERESMLTTPASADGGLPLPSLTSIASITRSLSFRSDDQVVTPADKVEKFKSFWDEKLRMTMDRIAHRSKIDAGAAEYERERDELDVFHLLLKLYAHQDVVEELYASYDANASDFEFYIPQLCTFYIHGNYEKQHQLECFLMSRSGESLAFAHRLSWFLKSFCNDARSYQSEYLSVTSSPEEENADLLIAIQQRGGVPAVLMEQGLNIEEVVERGPNVMLRRASSFDIDAAAQATIPRTASVAEDDETFTTYLQDKRQVLMYEAKPEEGNDQQVALYNATPNFVKALTDLADRLIPLPLAQRNEELRRGLTEIAAVSLPSNVIYLPIGNTYHRVKSIQIEECFTFSTKERVPYFLCVEVIDYVTERRASDPKKARRSLLNRRRSRSKSRKFGLNLRFKKNRESLSEMPRSDGSLCDTRNSTKPQNLAEVQDLLNGLHDGEYPNELLYEEESKTNEEPDSSKTTPYDLFGEMRVIFAITPEKASLTDAEVATRMNEGADGDDEKEACSESAADTDQKKRMGQWGLPRVRRRGKQPRPSAPKTSSKFDNFYSAWFAKKQKDEPLVAQNANADIPEIVSTDTHIHEESPTEGGNQCDIDTTEPLPEPKSEEPPKPATENMKPKRRGRDISISLDFTDADAWKLNFELEDVLTDADLETANDTDAPEVTPEADQEMVDDSEESEDEKPVIVFRERWSEKEERIRRESPHGDHPGWRLLPVIVKSNDDLRQEQFAAQLIAQCDRIFQEYSLPLRLRPYHIIATSAKCGLIEAVPNTVSLDSLKRNDPHYTTLLDFYQRLFGTDTTEFRHARRNFVESLAAYSILCYVFQIKDRHNGNILIDTDGHVIHIDFGFLLTNSPGSNLNFERAPFKLTDEFVQLMGGPRSAAFRYFRSLCIRAYLALRRNMDKIILLVEMMLVGNEDLPCFAGGKRAVIEGLRDRLKPGARTSECQLYVNQLIDRSINNWRTRWYDKYQRAWVGIL